ncbi:MAG: type II toxin-antitoxin system prevent-host-death family antitoxin [Lentisphaerae bacterium]|nr:type II toxin-antitoxin system prevent-host-death family antitoxin [Lentisphaerota bacterium]MBT5606705.1 type II toxin-antitoxin system prevent-host-death family antitoxin [Lentisphaerota bacterium]MBT7056992.1 type II toxin-antitoxin system prevent-host-death family antitoxin [Lentisphaerota bacterium]MBT7842077.1 type II toxin-antitoxin system prevent-host-death family antitoxin [Lentisphaerota bacterium]
MHSSTWQLQEAKARFSELVNQALESGPQTVTRRGQEAVMVVAAADFRADAPSKPRDFFRRGPYLDGVALERDRSLPREVDLCDS